ncbi:NAD(P)/FAD-dependent oxidoreductase [Enterovirga sp. CN4-39]|uniref:NAD(P)/FAD-dependent oxidoreductase n=1 Tax=Enterovirga sp. CN4-39 TaxID=3400910 RepID=UPI003BFF69E8
MRPRSLHAAAALRPFRSISWTGRLLRALHVLNGRTSVVGRGTRTFRKECSACDPAHLKKENARQPVVPSSAFSLSAQGLSSGSFQAGVERFFEPRRRHIAAIPLPATVVPYEWPFFRCPSWPFYMKPEAGQLLASLMDAELDRPGDCMSDDLRIAEIVDAVERLTTVEVRRVTRGWAGHRTFSPDDAPVIGPDPLVAGFFWAAGLGGAGVMSSPAVGELVATAITGSRQHPLQEQVDPARRIGVRRFGEI